jgi:DNA-binding NarL/FixJ family response regulator
MIKVKVLVANHPRLMREAVLLTLFDQTGIEVAGEAESDEEIIELTEKTHPDVVILSLRDPQAAPAIRSFLARHYPQIRVVAISPNKNFGVCYETLLSPRTYLFNLSQETLLKIVRRDIDLDEEIDSQRTPGLVN